MKFYRTNSLFLKANTEVLVSGEVLRIKWENLNNPQNPPTYGDVSLDFTQIKASPNFADHTLWVLSEYKQMWVPLFSETFINKESIANYARQNGNLLALLYVRLASDNLADCSLCVSIHKDSTLDAPGKITQVDSARAVYDTIFPKLAIGDPVTQDSVMTFSINLLDAEGVPLNKDAAVFCESTVGALLTPRVQIVNGVGVAKVEVLSLDGVSGKLKAGFKFYTGVAEKNFTV